MPTWEQRWHPLREEWVVVAAHRQNRPWTGGTVAAPATTRPPYAPDCYLCPGNARVGGARNHLLKYLAGPEIGGGNFLSDTSPEASAAELKALPGAHHAAPAPSRAQPATPTPGPKQ